MWQIKKIFFFFFLKFKDEKIQMKEKERHGAPQDVKAMQRCMKLSKHFRLKCMMGKYLLKSIIYLNRCWDFLKIMRMCSRSRWYVKEQDELLCFWYLLTS